MSPEANAPCAGVAGEDEPNSEFWATFEAPIQAFDRDNPEVEDSWVPVESDPYQVASVRPPGESAGNGFQPERSFANSKVATFADRGELGVALGEGMVHGNVPWGMNSLLNHVKHTASQDAFFRGRGLFPLPVDWSLGGRTGDARFPQGVQAWLALTCHALNVLAGVKKKAPLVGSGFSCPGNP